MNPLLNMILSSIFSGMGGIGNNMMNPMMPNQNRGNNSGQMGGINMMSGNPLLNMLMGSIGGGMNSMNCNPLINMLMGNMGNGNNNTPFNNMNGNNANMNNMGNANSTPFNNTNGGNANMNNANNTSFNNMNGNDANMNINSLLSMLMGN